MSVAAVPADIRAPAAEELTTEDTEEHREVQAPNEPYLLCATLRTLRLA